MRINYLFIFKKKKCFSFCFIVISILSAPDEEIKNIIALKMIMLRFLLLMPGRQKKETYLHYI